MDLLLRRSVRSSVFPRTLSIVVASAAALCAGGAHAAQHIPIAASNASSAPKASEAPAQAIVEVSDAWVRWLPGALPAAGYMTLRNPSTAPLILVGADSPDYDSVMLHQSIRNGATAKMKMADALLLPPAQTVLIEPGGYHFMLSAVRHPIVPGATVTLRLRFADGRTQSVAMPVSPATRTK